MVDDLRRNLREQFDALANDIATQLFNEIKPYVANGKYEGLHGYVENVDQLIVNKERIDPEALELIVQSDVQREATVAVIGYTDWLACRIVRHDNYSVPTLEEVDCRAIEDKMYINSSDVLRRVISYIHAQPELPLLGKIEGGYFKPDHQIFEAWKSLYDWEK